MRTIEDRLSLNDWEPMPNDTIVGVITGIMARTSKSGAQYPVLIIQDDDGEHVVSCALMANEVISNAPAVGDKCGVRFHGPQQRSDSDGTWDKYSIAFETEAAEVDWAAMAASRNSQ